MWSNNDDYSDSGEPVKLYVPTQGPARKNNTGPIESHIGGVAFSDLGPAPDCEHCTDKMKLLVQLHREEHQMEKFLTVYGCPQSSCFNKIKFENGFSHGNGIMSCRMLVRPIREKPKPAPPAAPVKSSWYSDDGDDMDNDWGADAGVDDLESKIAAMEANLQDGAMPKKEAAKTPKGTAPAASKTSPDSSSFPCYMLNEQVEPPAPRQQIEDDDVGMGASDDKIRNMLARYMAEEEDEDILAALSGTVSGGGGGGEADERLSEEDRVLLGFQDRLRRVPRQVVRYAPGGIPMWSIPTEAPVVPSASDGSPRSFECQLLPPLLLTLNVDKFSGTEEAQSGINGMLSEGMNWGSVAVFTRSNPTSEVETEEVLLIQKSVDEVSEIEGQPKMDLSPAIAVVEDMDDDDEFTPDA